MRQNLRSSTFAMLFATRACIFVISADQNVWLRSALRSLRPYGNSLFCDRLRLFAICDLRSSAIIWKLPFKLTRLTEDNHSMFFDPRFLSYSFLKELLWSISLRKMCDKFEYNFDVAGKGSGNSTLQLLYLNRQKVWNFDLTKGQPSSDL